MDAGGSVRHWHRAGAGNARALPRGGIRGAGHTVLKAGCGPYRTKDRSPARPVRVDAGILGRPGAPPSAGRPGTLAGRPGDPDGAPRPTKDFGSAGVVRVAAQYRRPRPRIPQRRGGPGRRYQEFEARPDLGPAGRRNARPGRIVICRPAGTTPSPRLGIGSPARPSPACAPPRVAAACGRDRARRAPGKYSM